MYLTDYKTEYASFHKANQYKRVTTHYSLILPTNTNEQRKPYVMTINRVQREYYLWETSDTLFIM